VCFLFTAKIHDTEGGFVDNDPIMKSGPEAPFCSRFKGLENVTKSVVINVLVRKEVVAGSKVREIIDRQPR
jgi:hypothetical protein